MIILQTHSKVWGRSIHLISIQYFSTGIIPDTWLSGIIRLVCKKKSGVNVKMILISIDLSQHSQLLWKTITCVLNNRLNYFLESNNLLTSGRAKYKKLEFVQPKYCVVNLFSTRMILIAPLLILVMISLTDSKDLDNDIQNKLFSIAQDVLCLASQGCIS